MKKNYIIGICAVSKNYYRNAKRLIVDISDSINVDFLILTDAPSEFSNFDNVRVIQYNSSIFNYQDKLIIFEEGFKTHDSVLLVDADHIFLKTNYKQVLERFDTKNLEAGLYAREVFGPMHYSAVDEFFRGNLSRLPYGKECLNFCEENNLDTKGCLFVHESFFLIKKNNKIDIFLDTWKKLKQFWDIHDPTGYGEGFAIGIAAKTSDLKINATFLDELGKVFNHFTKNQKMFLSKEDDNGDYIKILNGYGLPLVVAFASTGAPDEIPKYEFFHSKMNCNYLFLKDRKKLWYHQGVKGFGDTIEELAENIKSVQKEFESKKIITIGWCGGGYGALLFGYLLKVDLILAASPRLALIEPWDDTVISIKNRKIAKSTFDIRYVDITRLKFDNNTKIISFVGLEPWKNPRDGRSYHIDDTKNMKKLWAIDNCYVLQHPNVGHDTAYHIIKNGHVERIIKSFISK